MRPCHPKPPPRSSFKTEGHCTNDSEAIRDLIRREQERTLQVEALRQALIEGENNGEASAFDVTTFKQRMSAADA